MAVDATVAGGDSDGELGSGSKYIASEGPSAAQSLSLPLPSMLRFKLSVLEMQEEVLRLGGVKASLKKTRLSALAAAAADCNNDAVGAGAGAASVVSNGTSQAVASMNIELVTTVAAATASMVSTAGAAVVVKRGRGRPRKTANMARKAMVNGRKPSAAREGKQIVDAASTAVASTATAEASAAAAISPKATSTSTETATTTTVPAEVEAAPVKQEENVAAKALLKHKVPVPSGDLKIGTKEEDSHNDPRVPPPAATSPPSPGGTESGSFRDGFAPSDGVSFDGKEPERRQCKEPRSEELDETVNQTGGGIGSRKARRDGSDGNDTRSWGITMSPRRSNEPPAASTPSPSSLTASLSFGKKGSVRGESERGSRSRKKSGGRDDGEDSRLGDRSSQRPSHDQYSSRESERQGKGGDSTFLDHRVADAEDRIGQNGSRERRSRRDGARRQISRTSKKDWSPSTSPSRGSSRSRSTSIRRSRSSSMQSNYRVRHRRPVASKRLDSRDWVDGGRESQRDGQDGRDSGRGRRRERSRSGGGSGGPSSPKYSRSSSPSSSHHSDSRRHKGSSHGLRSTKRSPSRRGSKMREDSEERRRSTSNGRNRGSGRQRTEDRDESRVKCSKKWRVRSQDSSCEGSSSPGRRNDIYKRDHSHKREEEKRDSSEDGSTSARSDTADRSSEERELQTARSNHGGYDDSTSDEGHRSQDYTSQDRRSRDCKSRDHRSRERKSFIDGVSQGKKSRDSTSTPRDRQWRGWESPDRRSKDRRSRDRKSRGDRASLRDDADRGKDPTVPRSPATTKSAATSKTQFGFDSGGTSIERSGDGRRREERNQPLHPSSLGGSFGASVEGREEGEDIAGERKRVEIDSEGRRGGGSDSPWSDISATTCQGYRNIKEKYGEDWREVLGVEAEERLEEEREAVRIREAQESGALPSSEGPSKGPRPIGSLRIPKASLKLPREVYRQVLDSFQVLILEPHFYPAVSDVRA